MILKANFKIYKSNLSMNAWRQGIIINETFKHFLILNKFSSDLQ